MKLLWFVFFLIIAICIDKNLAQKIGPFDNYSVARNDENLKGEPVIVVILFIVFFIFLIGIAAPLVCLLIICINILIPQTNKELFTSDDHVCYE